MTKRAKQIIKCKECGKEFAHNHQGTGRKPVYCPRHRNKGAKKRDLERAKDNLDPEEYAKFEADTDPEEWVAKAAAESSYESINVRLLALGRATYPAKRDVRKAALCAGIYGKSYDELCEMWELAKEHHQDITDLKPTAINREAMKALALHVLLSQAKGHQCAPSQLGNAAKSLAAIMPEGGSQYSDITINVSLPEQVARKKK